MGRDFYLLLTLVRSLDAISYVLVSFLWIRTYRERKRRWGGVAYGALIMTVAVQYLSVLAGDAMFVATGHPVALLTGIMGAGPVVITVLMFHVF